MGNCFTCFKEPTQTALDKTTDHKDKEEMTEDHLHPAPSHVPAPTAPHDTNLSNGNHLSAPPEVTTTIIRLCQPSRRTHSKSAAAIMGISDSKSSETKLNGLFEQYKDKSEDSMLAEGIEQFCQDLQVSPDDFKILVLAWKLNAEQMCRFTRLEFITGMKAIRADSIKSLQNRLPELVSEVNNNYELFKDLYRFTFRFGLDSSSGQRILPTDMAVILWKLVFTFREPPILNRWLNFLETHQITRGIPKDTWNMFLNFSEHVANDLSCYDDNEAWPSLFDDFVEFENDQVNQNIPKDMEKESDGLIITKN
ncbi:defective in cullin neddylation 1 domain containing SCCRO3 isoform X1 [Leptinotarsa decemlineata]|uniref:defective in cullin neddylation 1 domain containing SCCRO3 isoform X1 n=1 Tax=Leptinotarsa decemlineata TaxID=7539 RepID=UPI003D30B5DF